jgi:hypothetical protein
LLGGERRAFVADDRRTSGAWPDCDEFGGVQPCALYGMGGEEKMVRIPIAAARGSKATSFSTARVVMLGVLVVWQMYTSGRLAAYGLHLRESRDRHAELQRSLSDAEATIAAMRNSTQNCADAEKNHASVLANADRERRATQMRLEEVLEMNMWLNQTASARDAALRAEQQQRATLEGSVQSLKEQMNLMVRCLAASPLPPSPCHRAIAPARV